jgi:tetratricopeptide (TPR) repeat protein
MKAMWCVMGLMAPFGLQAQPAPGCELVRTKATSTAESDAIRSQLSAGNFDALDAELERRLLAHAQGRDTDLRLYRDLDLAVGNGPELKGAIHRWAAARPRSFFANLMAAMYHVNAGFRERGTAFADKTSQAQFEAMQQAFTLAVPYSNAAMALNPRSALPHTNMLPMAGARAGYSAVTTILSEGLLADPGSIAVRSIAMPYLAPRWGGSFEAVSDLVRRAGQAKLPASQIHYLRFSELMEQGSHWWRVDKAPGKALDAYRLALRACPNSERAMDGLLANASQLNDWDAVIDAVTRAEAAGHVFAKAMARRGLAHEKQGDMARAVQDYERAVSLGDGWATGKLGYLHLVGKEVPKDLVKARALLTTAVSQGNTSAQRNLDWLNRQAARTAAEPSPQPVSD